MELSVVGVRWRRWPARGREGEERRVDGGGWGGSFFSLRDGMDVASSDAQRGEEVTARMACASSSMMLFSCNFTTSYLSGLSFWSDSAAEAEKNSLKVKKTRLLAIVEEGRVASSSRRALTVLFFHDVKAETTRGAQ